MKRKYQLVMLVLMALTMIFSVGCSEEDMAALQGMVNTDDTTAPVAELISPAHGSTVSEDFSLRINVMDAENYSTITKITLNDSVDIAFTRDGVTSSLFSSDMIDITTLDAGSRQSVVIIASNNNALISTNEFYFYTAANSTNTNVIEDSNPPIVAIVSPTDGSDVSSSFSVTVNASDAETSVTNVKIVVDGVEQNVTTKPSGSYVSANFTVADGTYTVSVTAYDAAGNTATDSVSVTYTANVVVKDLNLTLVDIVEDYFPADAQSQTVTTNRPTINWSAWSGADAYLVSVWNLAEDECYFAVVYDSSVTSIQYGDETGHKVSYPGEGIFQSASPLTLSDGTYIVGVVAHDGSQENVAMAYLKGVITVGGSKSVATKSVDRSFITKDQYNQMLLNMKK